MKKLLIIILFPFCVQAQKDSLIVDTVKYKTHFNLSVGSTLSTYWGQGINLSSQPLGYRFGIGVTKDLPKDYEAGFNVWYQFSQFTGIKTFLWDSYYARDIRLTTDIQFQQIYFGGELNKKIKKFYFGVNGGVYYLLKSKAFQVVEGGEGYIEQTNIYNNYIIYSYQYDSYQNILNPFIGISVSYFPLKWLGIKYQNNIDVCSSPWKSYQYYRKINPVLNCLTLTVKIK